MRKIRLAVVAFVGVITFAPGLAAANPVGVVKESGRTAGYAVRDSVLTVGRTIGAFFRHGPRTAKYTWTANAARTKYDAHVGKHRIAWEAHDER